MNQISFFLGDDLLFINQLLILGRLDMKQNLTIFSVITPDGPSFSTPLAG